MTERPWSAEATKARIRYEKAAQEHGRILDGELKARLEMERAWLDYQEEMYRLDWCPVCDRVLDECSCVAIAASPAGTDAKTRVEPRGFIDPRQPWNR